MFNLVRKETFKETVKLQVKTDNGWREESFVGIFKRVNQTRQQELTNIPFNEVLDEVLVGWEMKNMEGAAVEFTAENLAAFKEIPGAARAAVMAYMAANIGAKEKN